MSDKANSLHSALDAIKAERDALKAGRSGQIVPTQNTPEPETVPYNPPQPSQPPVSLNEATENILNSAQSPVANPAQDAGLTQSNQTILRENQPQHAPISQQVPQSQQAPISPSAPEPKLSPALQPPAISQVAPLNTSPKSHFQVANWKYAFFAMCLIGPVLGVAGTMMSGSLLGTNKSFQAAGLSGELPVKVLGKSDRQTVKTNRMQYKDVMKSRHNCTELVIDSRTGVTKGKKCAFKQPGPSIARRNTPSSTTNRPVDRFAVTTPTMQLEPGPLAKPVRPRVVPIKVRPITGQRHGQNQGRPRGIIKRQWP